MDQKRLTHLRQLEAESIHIIREVAAEFSNPVMMYSIGKDSSVMLHLARKAFYPGTLPFPLLHVDTGWKFREMYEFRDRTVKAMGAELLVHRNPEGVAMGINPFVHGSAKHTDIMKTEGLKQALNKYGFDAAFGGARRDEEKSRAKERIYSFRDRFHRWDPKNQRPELWHMGAGPGDSGLLTLRGLQVMQLADVVLYDHLVSEEVLDLVRRDADRICVGKRASAHTLPQEEINQMLVSLALKGKRVVRLKGGDPFIFGRGGEELQAAQQAGVPFQVVPGVTAAAGATAYAGIPLTHRDYAQSVMFITGHCRPDGDDIDWPSLARARQTLAIYMGTVKAAAISEALIQHGRAPSTPVAVISCGTRQDQQVLTGTLEQLEALAASAPTPALLVIGEVVNLHGQLAWFKHSAQQGARESAVVNLA